MDFIIIIAICIGLIQHKNISSYWEANRLPYPYNFVLFVWIFNILILINLVWIFGFVIGALLFALTFFQIIFATFLWLFLIPGIIKENKRTTIEFLFENQPKHRLFIYWGTLVFILFILTVLNFFTGNYASLTEEIFDLADGNYKLIISYAVITIIIGNVLRVITMKLLTR